MEGSLPSKGEKIAITGYQHVGSPALRQVQKWLILPVAARLRARLRYFDKGAEQQIVGKQDIDLM